ncbi:MAG: family 78 glycoside hydrolase catalytic domain, partial [Candidatus Hydrogenedentota bacterium]
MGAIALLTTSLFMTAMDADAATPVNLRCEYLEGATGIDIPAPRLSWELDAAGIGAVQSAYQVRVASTSNGLDQPDLWDSGKVEEDTSVHVPYAGESLPSSARVYWQVRVWDAENKPGPWSSVARFTTGVFDTAANWRAGWLAAPEQHPDTPLPRFEFGEGQWLWNAGDTPIEKLPAGHCFFRKTFTLPEDDPVVQARCVLIADDGGRLYLNDIQALNIKKGQHAYLIDVGAKLRPGKNILAAQVHNKSEGPGGIALRLVVTLESGKEVTLVSDDTWNAAPLAPGEWKALDYADSNWPVARTLGPVGVEPWGMPELPYDSTTQGAPSPVFRREFSIDKSVAQAIVHVSGLGYYELRLNGAKVGDRLLDPAFTRYDKRCLYSTYDVTDVLSAGKNAFGLMLGHGWFDMHAVSEWDFDIAPWRGTPRFTLQLRVVYEDGTETRVTSDDAWKAARGPITFDCIRNGEFYDARREMPGWDTPGFDDSGWESARAIDAPEGSLRSQMMPPVRVTDTFAPVSISEPRPGVYVFDMGQNMAGICRLRVAGPRGTEVTLRHGETLTDDGYIDPRLGCYLYSGDFQTDRYTLKGGGIETWSPRFVYHGFQYVQVEGLPEPPTKDTLTALAVNTGFERTGAFESSSELFNSIQHATQWAYRSNYVGYPLDCPHREKNGWTGDAHLAGELGLYNFAAAAAYTKWLDDFADEQQENGEYAAIIPTSGWGYGIGPAWDSAYVLIPWYLYVYRGDTRILARHYDNLKLYLEFLGSKAKDHIVDYGLGDWAPADSKTNRALTSTAYFYTDADTMAKIARVLGKEDDAKHFAALAARIKEAFNKKFYKGDGIYSAGTQTAMAVPLGHGLVPEGEVQAVADALAEAVHARDDHLDCGILGTKHLLDALTENAHADLAYTVATQTTLPSWGYMIEQGATTLWENWNGEFSQNHIMFGEISAWFFKTLAGIRPDVDSPGFKHIVLKPHVLADLEWVKAETPTVYGELASGWKRSGGTVTYTLRIPHNTTATLYLDTPDPAKVTVDGYVPGERAGVE